ncbi:MAG TPA: AbrB/MazE/SpoVT family DNA-binding domain-containing protein [Opitutales bacterium]|nr:AbrB/MazE/SpoVT family DNA-binding domain-containing protein [Opitutales bacterium]
MTVESKVSQWGHSLAVRIPKDMARSISLTNETPLVISVHEGAIVMKPVRKRPTLKELVSKITPENKHAAIDFGRKGREIW